MTPTVVSLDHLVLTVRDISATLAFYTHVLGMRSEPFQPASGPVRQALKFGSQKINLHQAGQEFLPKATAAAPGTADLCFLSDRPLTDWLDHLETCKVAVEDGPVRRTGATGPILSLYVYDPDGNLIEISTPDT